MSTNMGDLAELQVGIIDGMSHYPLERQRSHLMRRARTCRSRLSTRRAFQYYEKVSHTNSILRRNWTTESIHKFFLDLSPDRRRVQATQHPDNRVLSIAHNLR